MKKTAKESKRLLLTTETVRDLQTVELADDKLREAVGGTWWSHTLRQGSSG